MDKNIKFECIECGYLSPKYYGKCPQCLNWNSMVEVKLKKESKDSHLKPIKPTKLDEINQDLVKRTIINLPEFNRVLGGGIVDDSVILIGGEPGIGKSTLLLEIAKELSYLGERILYFSGEESLNQIKLRSERLDIKAENLFLISMGSLEDIKDSITKIKPKYLIIDSIQTLNSSSNTKLSGSITALRYLTSELIELAKLNNLTVFIIGHITKDGQIAGPKSLEHMVDAVLYFESEIKSDLRILRANKNRFGPINELGIFQMTSKGLISVDNPQVFVNKNNINNSGISIFPSMNGLRSLLIEIQALVTETPFTGNPRRITVGFDNYRLSMLISIIEKKLKLPFYKSDVFLNIAGGTTLKDTGGDLSVISALISSYKNLILPANLIIIGEVGLTGEVRPVSFFSNRYAEAVRQGFKKFIIPQSQIDKISSQKTSIFSIKNIYELLDCFKKLA